MTPESRAKADVYYEMAGSWADDRVSALTASRRTAWIVAGIACVVALLLAIAIVVMLPLKTVVPYTLLVDRQTGYVQALDPIERSRIAPDAALTQSFLVQYVLAREGFDRATIQADYAKVTLWSEGATRTAYVNAIQASNPASPLVALPRDTVIEARVRSVSSLGGTTALVRFETVLRRAGSAAQPPQYWVAVVRYRYSDAPLLVEDRYLNPLGFTVTSYRKSSETPPAPVEPPPLPAAQPVRSPQVGLPSATQSPAPPPRPSTTRSPPDAR